MDATKSSAGLFETGGGEGSAQGRQFSLEKNFGEIEFNWVERTVSLRAIGEDRNAPPLLMAKVEIDQLSGRKEMPASQVTSKDFQAEETDIRHHLYKSDWVCINHRGRDTTHLQIAGHVTSTILLVTLVPLPLLLPAILGLCFIRRWFCRTNPYRSNEATGTTSRVRLSKCECLSAMIPSKCKAAVSLANNLSKQDLQKISRVSKGQRSASFENDPVQSMQSRNASVLLTLPRRNRLMASCCIMSYSCVCILA